MNFLNQPRIRCLGSMVFQALVCLALVGCTTSSKLQYPSFEVKDVQLRSASCDSMDRYLRQVDAVRWSMREDGVELETDFTQLVQVSLATASAIAMLSLLAYARGDPRILALPYAETFTDADRLERADAMLIALLARREDLRCPPHPECEIIGEDFNKLHSLRSIRANVENKEITESVGIEQVTKVLDGLCPIGNHYPLRNLEPSVD